MNFVLKYHHGFSMADLEAMAPWERDLYVGMIAAEMEKRKGSH